MNIYKAIRGRKKKTKSGVYVCPSCGKEHWSISIEKDGTAKCVKCHKIMAKEKDVDKLIVEREVDAFVCPVCRLIVEDTPLNYTGEETIDGKMAILCPKCNNYVNGLPLMHHGHNFEDFIPFKSETDYFFFQHVPCKDKKHGGFSDAYACLIDNTGRIIFNVQCLDCQAVDAVKTHAPFRGQTTERIFLSPKLKNRIAEHPWDNL